MNVVHSLAWSQAAGLLAVGCEGSLIRVWDQRNGEFDTLLSHEGRVSCLAFSEQGRDLVSAASPGSMGKEQPSIYLWRVQNGAIHLQAQLPNRVPGSDTPLHTGAMTGIAFAKDPFAYYCRHVRDIHDRKTDDGKMIIATSSSNAVVLWEATIDANGFIDRTTFVDRVETKQVIEAIAFAEDGALLMATGSSGTVYVWKVTAVIVQEKAVERTDRRQRRRRRVRQENDKEEHVLTSSVTLLEQLCIEFLFSFDTGSSNVAFGHISSWIDPSTLFPVYSIDIVSETKVVLYYLFIQSPNKTLEPQVLNVSLSLPLAIGMRMVQSRNPRKSLLSRFFGDTRESETQGQLHRQRWYVRMGQIQHEPQDFNIALFPKTVYEPKLGKEVISCAARRYLVDEVVFCIGRSNGILSKVTRVNDEWYEEVLIGSKGMPLKHLAIGDANLFSCLGDDGLLQFQDGSMSELLLPLTARQQRLLQDEVEHVERLKKLVEFIEYTCAERLP